MKIDRLQEELAKTKEKANQWQARVRDLEKQITEQENLQILHTVRSIAATPEDLRNVLDMLRAGKELPRRNDTQQEDSGNEQ